MNAPALLRKALALDATAIAGLIPHAGSMCLLERVLDCDTGHIACSSERHRAKDNPLRRDDSLSALHAIEFAAQAMALHGRLIAEPGAAPLHGLLMSVRKCVLARDRLDDCAGPLRVEAWLVASAAEAMSYRFRVSAGDELVAEGRASVTLAAGEIA